MRRQVPQMMTAVGLKELACRRKHPDSLAEAEIAFEEQKRKERVLIV